MSETPDLVALTRALIATMGESDLTEAEWTLGEYRLKLKRGGPTPVVAPAPAIPVAKTPEGPAAPSPQELETVAVTSPVYGMFYASAEPGAPALASVGMQVTEGQPLCVVEAMKTFTTITAPCAGVVAEIGPENGAEIAAGELLVRLVPDSPAEAA